MPPLERITGSVDRVSTNEIVGWIVNHDRANALESVFVETDLGEKHELKAIIYRHDIAEQLNRHEKLGFAIPLSALNFENVARLADRHGNTLANGVVQLSAPPGPRPPRHEKCSVFLHIQKTAGTALSSALRKRLPLSAVCLFYQGSTVGLDWGQLNNLPPSQCRAFELLIGHSFFGLDAFLRQPTRYYTFVREPMARLRSHYWHYRTNNIEALNIGGKMVPLHVVVNEGLVDEFDNLQTRMIAGVGTAMVPLGSMSDYVLKLAMQNIERRFDFVGMTEKLDIHSRMLFESMGLEPLAVERQNVTDRTSINESDACYRLIDWKKVGERNRFDAELYRLVSARFSDTPPPRELEKSVNVK